MADKEIIEGSDDLQVQLLDARKQIVELEARTATTLLPSQLLVIILMGPLFASFTIIGIVICWKTLNSPAEIEPHLRSILLVFALFANPVSAASGVIVGLMSDEIKARLGGKGFNSNER